MASASRVLVFLGLICGLQSAASCVRKSEQCCPAPRCPSGWTRLGSRCFLFNSKPASWTEAERMCLSMGGNLATVHNDEEHSFIKDMVQRGSGSVQVVWLGGFDAVKEGEWLWKDGSKFDFTRWASRQPDNQYGRENCLVAYWHGDYWNDANCDNRCPFVCSTDL